MKRCDGTFPLQKEEYVSIPFKVGGICRQSRWYRRLLYFQPVLVFCKGRFFVYLGVSNFAAYKSKRRVNGTFLSAVTLRHRRYGGRDQTIYFKNERNGFFLLAGIAAESARQLRFAVCLRSGVCRIVFVHRPRCAVSNGLGFRGNLGAQCVLRFAVYRRLRICAHGTHRIAERGVFQYFFGFA